MNNLVSKNPVQRFKQGKKIVKAKNSWGKDFGRVNLGVNTPTIDFKIPSVEISREQIESLPSVPITYSSYPYRGPIVRLGIQKNPDISPSASQDPYLIQGSTKGGMQREADRAIVQGLLNQSSEENSKPISDEKKQSTPHNKQRFSRKNNNSPKFYGQTVGGKVLARGSDFGDRINNSKKQALLNAGFKNENFNDVKSFQKALNNFFSKDGAGSIIADDMWGDQTQKAFEMALFKAGYDPSNNKIALTPTTISNIYSQNRLSGLQAAGLMNKSELPTIPTGGISNFTPLSTARTYNKADVRNFIRSKGKGAYDFSGSQRKALRMVLNGQGTDEDKAIVKAMGLFKQEGQLVSKNPIKRFKLRTKI